MPQICLYLQLHQPYRLGDFDLFDIGSEISYFDAADKHNAKIFKKVARKSYLPMLRLLLQLSKASPSFKLALSASGIFLEQAMAFEPKIIKILKLLAKSQQVEFLAETYYHSLSSLYSEKEFEEQVAKHSKVIKKLFGVSPIVFRNTELIYSNDIAKLVEKLGFTGVLTEAVPRYLKSRPRTKIYKSSTKASLPLLLKHAQLSDDIAFRFSDPNWSDYPISASKYFTWLNKYHEDAIINLFMDFETFGEHQWKDTGIFDFFKKLVKKISKSKTSCFKTPSELFNSILTSDGQVEAMVERVYDVPEPISWADVDRDLTAWLDNDLQQDSISKLYELEDQILKSKDQKLLEDWRKLQCSDHFYYMCTKWAADGDVHAYFSPYDSPLEAYRKYSIVLADLAGRLKNHPEKEA
ncbi:MAG: glycoside hydrolase family 57 protein [Patescibacteria group bacterium]